MCRFDGCVASTGMLLLAQIGVAANISLPASWERGVPFWYKGNIPPGMDVTCLISLGLQLRLFSFPYPFAAVTVELMTAHPAAAHPAPPRNILLGKADGRECGWTNT